MEYESLVPCETVCKWLKSSGWTAKTHHEFRKYSLSKKPILLAVPMADGLEVHVLSGQLEWTLPAPTAREILEALPARVVIEKQKAGTWHVSTNISPNQSVFQIADKLEDALGDLWNALRDGGNL